MSGRGRTPTAPAPSTRCQARMFSRINAPMSSRANESASNPHSGHGRSRTQVQFLVSGVIDTRERYDAISSPT